jgi:hypothetical protein
MIGLWERSGKTVVDDDTARLWVLFSFSAGFFEMFLARAMPAC